MGPHAHAMHSWVGKGQEQKECALLVQGSIAKEGVQASPMVRNKARLSTSSTAVQHCTGSSSQSNWARKTKGIQTVKKEVKLSLFAYDNLTYRYDLFFLFWYQG